MPTIRKAELKDVDRLMEIFDRARKFMAAHGNANQWINGYPGRDFMESEIKEGHCYACCDETDGNIIGTFCFIPGPDPTYSHIEDGEWPDDEPYYVIHRLASDGSRNGIGEICFDWCFSHYPNIRIDTHRDNKVMLSLLKKYGFTRCGIIYIANGTPRIAFIKKNEANRKKI